MPRRSRRVTTPMTSKLVTELVSGDIAHFVFPHMVDTVEYDDSYVNKQFPETRKLVVTFTDGGQFFAMISPNRTPESVPVEVRTFING